MLIALTTAVTVAIPIWEGRISPVLDVASRFLVIDFDKGRETGRREFLVGHTPSTSIIDGIKELGADILVCGAVSRPMAFGLTRAGVRVLPHICGEIEEVIQAFLLNTLDRPEFRMPGCCQSLCGWHQRFRHRRGSAKSNLHNRRV